MATSWIVNSLNFNLKHVNNRWISQNRVDIPTMVWNLFIFPTYCKIVYKMFVLVLFWWSSLPYGYIHRNFHHFCWGTVDNVIFSGGVIEFDNQTSVYLTPHHNTTHFHVSIITMIVITHIFTPLSHLGCSCQPWKKRLSNICVQM